MTHARILQSMERESTDPFFWTRNLRRIYDNLQNNSDDIPSMIVLQSNRMTIGEPFVGLETYCVPSIFAHVQAQRQAQWRDIQQWQANPTVSCAERAERISEACASHSRVSNGFAHYLAKQHMRRGVSTTSASSSASSSPKSSFTKDTLKSSFKSTPRKTKTTKTTSKTARSTKIS